MTPLQKTANNPLYAHEINKRPTTRYIAHATKDLIAPQRQTANHLHCHREHDASPRQYCDRLAARALAARARRTNALTPFYCDLTRSQQQRTETLPVARTTQCESTRLASNRGFVPLKSVCAMYKTTLSEIRSDAAMNSTLTKPSAGSEWKRALP